MRRLGLLASSVLVVALVLAVSLVGDDVDQADAAALWDVETTPPALQNPTRLTLSAETPTAAMPAWGILCSGRYHSVRLAPNEDAVITFSGSRPLRYPVWIVGGRNVRIVGLEMSLATQPGCGVGQLPNSGSSAKNIHPRIPGAMAVRLENWGTSFVEGADIDLRGHEADCFVVRNPVGLTNAAARSQRHVVLQNTNCRGIEGLGRSSIGDGVHGDLLQNQGNDVMSSLVLENVSVRSSMEGLVLHEWDGYSGARSLTIRRFDYAADERYRHDDAYEQWGTAFAAWAENWTLESVYLDDPAAMDYGFVNDQRWGATQRGVVKAHPAVHAGLPANGSFAPSHLVGREYRSPHDPGLASSSAEPSDQVVRLYQAAFGRHPDPEGLAYWSERSRMGLGLERMADFFAASREWEQRFGSGNTPEDLVRIMYANVLGRAPDTAGHGYWVGRLRIGELSSASLLVSFSESPENKERTGTSGS